MRNSRLATVILLCVLSLQCTWCVRVISRLAFRHQGQLVAGLFEDAMISMTYARNFVDGFGLNWGRYGLPVEGFTHPLWLVVMVGANLVPVERGLKGFFVQGASLGILMLVVVLSARLARRHFARASQWGWLLVAIPVAFDRSLMFWSIAGLESGLQALLILAAMWWVLAITEEGQDRHLQLFATLGAMCLLRLDMLPFAALLALAALRFDPRRLLRRWLRGLAIFAGMLGSYEVFGCSTFTTGCRTPTT